MDRLDVAASFVGERLSVAVIAGYLGQVGAIDLAIAGSRDKWQALDVECATVDSFQGREADVVIYSVVRSNEKRKIGFLNEPPRLNVALSRSRDALVIIGDHAFIRSASGDSPFGPVQRYIDEHPADCALREVPR